MSLPLKLYTADQVRKLDRIAIDEFNIPGFTLMQRAGQATFKQMIDSYPDTQSLCVVCGSGNNGGDGYVIATLAKKAGLTVSVIQMGEADSIKGDALLARESFLKLGVKTSPFKIDLLDVDIIFDAIFGTGLTRDITGDWAVAINAINQSPAKKVAVDIPSGLCADTGRILGTCIKADLTVTYIGLKSGLFTGQARDYTGAIGFDGLQVPDAVYNALSPAPSRELIPEDIIHQTLKPRSRSSHKGDFGNVLLIGGAQGMSGAIRLAAEASLRCGAGLVNVATHPAHAKYININRPEIMAHGIEQKTDLKPLLEKANVVAVGPGLGTSEWAQDLLTLTLNSKKPMVVDADALNLLAIQSVKNRDNWILTPHPKEGARLLAQPSSKEIELVRYRSIEKIQQKYGGVCVLKGAGSLVNNGMKTVVCSAGNPGMSSGGMGDVLCGVIAALLAQGLSLFDAAATGTYIHAKAADIAAVDGERGMLASDLFPHLRALVNEVK